MMRSLSMSFPFLPPSENRIRVHRKQGGQTYSREAQNFIKRFADHARENYFAQIAKFTAGHRHSSIYALQLRFVFDTLVNKGWLKKAAKTVYKKKDVGNRDKLLQDCVVMVLGNMDDSIYFDVQLVKTMGPDVGVHVGLWEVDPDDYGIPHEYQQD